MSTQIKLECAGGQPLSLRHIVHSHGLAGVTPWERTDADGLRVAVPTSQGACQILIEPKGTKVVGGKASVAVVAGGGLPQAELGQIARRLLGLERDLTGFHAGAAADPDLAWIVDAGAGAMARGATVFEDVIRTILTTNCAWSSTVQMCGRLTELCGTEVPGATGIKVFPTPEAVSELSEETLKAEVRVGYRAANLIETSRRVAEGLIDLEELSAVPRSDLPDAEVERRLRSLPGVGPYAAAHTMLLIGRPSLPILDSWTRPKYARLTGRSRITDAQILKRVAKHSPDSGLALWLILTKDWFDGSGTVDE